MWFFDNFPMFGDSFGVLSIHLPEDYERASL